jgi:uncharacterized protein with HEPN domain
MKSFFKDGKTIDATIRAIEVVGEAATKIRKLPNSAEFFEKYDYVNWEKASSMRNRIIHGYEDINYEIIWNTAKTDFPRFKEGIERVIKEVRKETEISQKPPTESPKPDAFAHDLRNRQEQKNKRKLGR